MQRRRSPGGVASPSPARLSGARPGDPPILYTDPAKIKFELGWRPRVGHAEGMRRSMDWVRELAERHQ